MRPTATNTFKSRLIGVTLNMCQRGSEYPVSIHSPDENNFVHQLSLCVGKDFWIGVHATRHILYLEIETRLDNYLH